MEQHITDIVKAPNKDFYQAKPLYEHDYGQIVRFIDFDLPDPFEVHFSNYLGSYGTGIVVVGQNREAAIPDELLQTGKTIHGWIMLHDDEAHSGNTVFTFHIPIKQRPQATSESADPVQQDSLTTAIELLNRKIETIDDDAAQLLIQELTDYTMILDGGTAPIEEEDGEENG